MPLYRTVVRIARQEKRDAPISGTPLVRGRCRLAHGGDSLEDDAAHERDTHAEAGEGERGVHAHLHAARIKHKGDDGEDRADCEANDAGTVKSGLGVGLGVHRRNPFSRLLFFRQPRY